MPLNSYVVSNYDLDDWESQTDTGDSCYHSEANICFFEGRTIICSISSYSNNLSLFQNRAVDNTWENDRSTAETPLLTKSGFKMCHSESVFSLFSCVFVCHFYFVMRICTYAHIFIYSLFYSLFLLMYCMVYKAIWNGFVCLTSTSTSIYTI